MESVIRIRIIICIGFEIAGTFEVYKCFDALGSLNFIVKILVSNFFLHKESINENILAQEENISEPQKIMTLPKSYSKLHLQKDNNFS